MPHENLIYAVNAHQLSNNEQENIIILIYAASAEIAKNHITVYQQQNQIRLQYSFLPLPLNTYFQRHADETLIAQLKTTAQELSEQNSCSDEKMNVRLSYFSLFLTPLSLTYGRKIIPPDNVMPSLMPK